MLPIIISLLIRHGRVLKTPPNNLAPGNQLEICQAVYTALTTSLAEWVSSTCTSPTDDRPDRLIDVTVN